MYSFMSLQIQKLESPEYLKIWPNFT